MESRIVKEITAERERQDEKYGKDRSLSVNGWNMLIQSEISEAINGYVLNIPQPHDYRTEMVQVAALAVAAIES